MTEKMAFFFGLLQGLTEFLPISSSGHFFLFEKGLSSNQNLLSLVIFLHGATLLSIVTVFFKDLKKLTLSLRAPSSYHLVLKIVVSSLPLIFFGLFFKSLVEQSFQETWVGVGFLMTAILLLSIFFKSPTSSHEIYELSYLKAFLIGVFQAVAVFPGFSRSGWTVSAGLLLGLSPQASVYYSFLIALPVILGSFFVEMIHHWDSLVFSTPLVFSFLTAYLSGVFSLFIVLKVVQKERFFLFGFYLLPLGFYLILF